MMVVVGDVCMLCIISSRYHSSHLLNVIIPYIVIKSSIVQLSVTEVTSCDIYSLC